MQKLALALGMSLALSACAHFTNPINETRVFELENGYGVAQSAAVAYAKLPPCPQVTKVCAKHDVVVKMASADHKARIALDALEAFSRNPANYPGLTFSSLLGAAMTAVQTLQAIVAAK